MPSNGRGVCAIQSMCTRATGVARRIVGLPGAASGATSPERCKERAHAREVRVRANCDRGARG